MTEALDLTGYLIRKLLGDLNDLSPELSNTVANVYHKAILDSMKLSGDHGGADSMADGDGSGKLSEPENRVQDLELLKPSPSNPILLMNRMIKSYREIKQTEPKRAARYIAQVIIDTMKYGIEDAPRKSEVKRWIERRMKTKTVQEIPGLIDRINVRS